MADQHYLQTSGLIYSSLWTLSRWCKEKQIAFIYLLVAALAEYYIACSLFVCMVIFGFCCHWHTICTVHSILSMHVWQDDFWIIDLFPSLGAFLKSLSLTISLFLSLCISVFVLCVIRLPLFKMRLVELCMMLSNFIFSLKMEKCFFVLELKNYCCQ